MYLILANNTSQMLMINKELRANGIKTDMVPAPPESGTVCAIAIKVSDDNLEVAKDLISKIGINKYEVFKEKKFKLQKLIDEKMGTLVSDEFVAIFKKFELGEELKKQDIVYLLKTQNRREVELLFDAADKTRKEMVGDYVEIRGAIEFSNYCRKSCKYCGINKNNKDVYRYRMSEQEILDVVSKLHKIGIKTVILQSGEDMMWGTDRIIDLIKTIKKNYGLRITLSIGEKSFDEYKRLKDAGADNFLLKIETTNREIFKNIHPDDDFDYRLKCSKWLKELGYINGSGNIIGLPGQKEEDIACDILFFKDMGINMIGIGPFIPAKGSEFESLPVGNIEMTLRTVAITRLVCKKVYIPSTTALASLDKDAQVMALKAGANTIMLINTPVIYRKKYKIYDNKNMVDMESAIYAVEKAGRKMPKYLQLDKEGIL